jgi:hypothetical protein
MRDPVIPIISIHKDMAMYRDEICIEDYIWWDLKVLSLTSGIKIPVSSIKIPIGVTGIEPKKAHVFPFTILVSRNEMLIPFPPHFPPRFVHHVVQRCPSL